MSYVNTPPSYYQSTIGPYGTPGWQFAPVPGWGINTQVSAYPPRVGVGEDVQPMPVKKVDNTNTWKAAVLALGAVTMITYFVLSLPGKHRGYWIELR